MRITKEQIKAHLAAVHDDTGWWLALNQIIDDVEAIWATEVCDPTLTDAAAHFHRGRLSAIKDFKTALHTTRQQATQKTPK